MLWLSFLTLLMQGCPCGYYTDSKKPCRCNPGKIQNYIGKISGPLLERIDVHIEMPALKYKELIDTKEEESSGAIKQRVEEIRNIQYKRFKSEEVFYNSQMNSRLIKKYCLLNEEAKELLKMAINELGLSARGYDKILKVSRTIADLAGQEIILSEHISEAIQYRSLDRRWCN